MRSIAVLKADGVLVPSAERRLAELYESRAGDCLRLAYLMTGDSDASEDIVQDAFVRCYASLRDRRSLEHLDAYLRRTIINLSHDRHRRLRTLRQHWARTRREITAEADPGARVAFGELLRSLPHRQRAAIVLRYHEDLSEQEAADVLGCSVGALKQLVQRALKTLRSEHA